MTTLAPPTVVDLIDAVVMASNNLIVWELANRKAGRPTMSEGVWASLNNADWEMNSCQDAIHERTTS